MHLNDQWVIEENREIKELPESNENTAYQHLWDTANTVLKGNLNSLVHTLKIQRSLK
jgi:hypothetical protein